jgi:hypothetical protein
LETELDHRIVLRLENALGRKPFGGFGNRFDVPDDGWQRSSIRNYLLNFAEL